jgi:hypothetical protein
MSLIKPQRSGDVQIPGFFTKQDTEADIARFVGAESGYRQVVSSDDWVLTSVVGVQPTIHLITFNFTYLVGANQLMVFTRVGTTIGPPAVQGQGFTALLPRLEELVDMHGLTAGSSASALSDLLPYYQELSSNSILVYGMGNSLYTGGLVSDILGLIPHTATPALSKERVTVKDQGDNEAVVLEGKGDGVLLTAPDGSRYLVRVNNNGNLVVEPR